MLRNLHTMFNFFEHVSTSYNFYGDLSLHYFTACKKYVGAKGNYSIIFNAPSLPSFIRNMNELLQIAMLAFLIYILRLN